MKIYHLMSRQVDASPNSINHNETGKNKRKLDEIDYDNVSDVENNICSDDANSNSNDDKYFNRSPSASDVSSTKMNESSFNGCENSSNNIASSTAAAAAAAAAAAFRTSHLCKDCYRTFKDINNYKEHRFQEHQEKYPNVRQCNMCSYATLLKSKYDCHMRCHLNNKVIKCQRCSYSTINIRHMSKHERMHMISNQSITNSSIPSLLSEKLSHLNSLKRKCEQQSIDTKVNKYQKTSISSSLSPSSASSTSSELASVVKTTNDAAKSNHILEYILKSSNSSVDPNKLVNEEYKENNQQQTVTSSSSSSAYTATLSALSQQYAALPLNPYINHAKSNDTSDAHPKNKYKKFLSNFNVKNEEQSTNENEEQKLTIEELKQKCFHMLNKNEYKCNLCEYKTKQQNNVILHNKKHKHEEQQQEKMPTASQDSFLKRQQELKTSNLVVSKELTPQPPTTTPLQHLNYLNHSLQASSTTTTTTQPSSTTTTQQQPNVIQNLFNTLRAQYPLLPPTYIYSLLAIQQQQQQQQHVNNYQFELHKQHHQQQQQQHQHPKVAIPFIPQQQQLNHSITIEDYLNNNNKSSMDSANKKQEQPSKCCDHQEELFLLRQNVYKMLYKTSKNVLLAFNLLNDPLSPQIDCILQSLLINNQDHESQQQQHHHQSELKQFLLNNSTYNSLYHQLNKPLFSTAPSSTTS